MDQKPSYFKSFFLVVGLVVVAALVAVTLQQQQQIKLLRGNSQTNQNTNNEVKSDTVQTGERQLISMPYDQLKGNCDVKGNSDAPGTTETFSDKTLGFQVDLPYNENWGTDKYKINPYEFDKQQNIINFGPISAFEGCGWVRARSIKIFDPMSSSDMLDELKKQGTSSEPKVIDYEGFKVIQYEQDGLCNTTGAIVIGKKHDYQFSSVCSSGTADDDFKFYQDIIKTLKSI